MGLVKGLGYLGATASNLDEWRAFAVDVLGMQEGDAPAGVADEAETLFLRMDGASWRLAIAPGHQPGVSFLGWEVEDEKTLAKLATLLRDEGFDVEEGSEEDRRARRVAGLIRTVDPGLNNVEFFHGLESASAPFSSPRNVRFVTGDAGMGHGFFNVPDVDTMKHFYEDLLGFRKSDTIAMGPLLGHFYHTNPRHHSLAFATIPGLPPFMQHLMVEVGDPQAVIDAYDALVARKAALSTSLGKHTNDYMFSFYVPSPSGFDIEYGSNGRRIEDDDAWVIGHYDAPSFWGHDRKEAPMPPELLEALAAAGAAPPG